MFFLDDFLNIFYTEQISNKVKKHVILSQQNELDWITKNYIYTKFGQTAT